MINKTAFERFNSKGFTLIELIIVFSILIILSTFSIAAFVNYSRSQTLQQSVNEFITVLNTAKSKSLSQDRSSKCLANEVLSGYSVTLNLVSNPNTYTINVVCSGRVVALTNVNGSSMTTKLSTGVSFNSQTASPPTTTTNIFFPLLTSGVEGSGDVVFSGYGATKTVTVTSNGVIK